MNVIAQARKRPCPRCRSLAARIPPKIESGGNLATRFQDLLRWRECASSAISRFERPCRPFIVWPDLSEIPLAAAERRFAVGESGEAHWAARARSDGARDDAEERGSTLQRRGSRCRDRNFRICGLGDAQSMDTGPAGTASGDRRIGFGAVHERLDPVGDSLRWLAKLGDGPVGGIAFGDVVVAGMVD